MKKLLSLTLILAVVLGITACTEAPASTTEDSAPASDTAEGTTPDSTPDSTPESTPDSTPDSTPGTTPDSTPVQGGGNDTPDTPSEYDTALGLIGEGKYTDAYRMLFSLSLRGDKQAEQKLGDFVVVYEKETDIYSNGISSVREFTFDENGNMTSEKTDGDTVYEAVYDSDGKLLRVSYYSSEYTYTYDSRGNLIMTVYESENGDRYTEESRYDERDKRTETVTTYSDGTKDVVRFEYDAQGNETRSEATYAYGGREITECSYNENGAVVRVHESYIEDGETVYELIVETEYDAQGRVLRERNNDVAEGVVTVFEYTYDEKGNLTRECRCDSEGKVVYETEYIYDSYGNLTASNSRDAETGDESHVKAERDENLFVIREEYSFSEEEVYVVEYVNDDCGNVLKMTNKSVYGSETETTVTEYDGYRIFYCPEK